MIHFLYFIYCFSTGKPRGGGEDDVFLLADQVRVDEKHFAAGATCKMYKGSLVSFGEFGDVPVAFKESIVPVTRGTKRSISKEVGFFRQLQHLNVIKCFGIEKSRYMLAYEMMEKKVNVDDGEEVLVHDVRMLLDELQDSLPWNIFF